MRYISTRGQAPARDFADVLLAGLAEDGGLFVPETWPHFTPSDWRSMRCLPYHALAARVMQPFVGTSIPFAVLEQICRDAYAGFGHPAVVPLVQLETHLFVQELFHGPTLAFKDMAMQVLGRLFDYVLTQRDTREVTISLVLAHRATPRVGGDRGLRRARARSRHHDPAPTRAHQRRAAAADDDGGSAQRRQYRRGRHVRRLPGPGEGDVRH